MPSNSVVDSEARKVSKQHVRLNFGDYPFPDSYQSYSFQKVQFINDTNLPMKIVSGVVGSKKSNLAFVRDVPDSRSFEHKTYGSFSIGGYIIIYNDGEVRSRIEPEGDMRAIEFAMSMPNFANAKINIKDKTNSEFTKGLGTYNTMHDGGQKEFFLEEDGKHYIAVADLSLSMIPGLNTWRFLLQAFNPTDSNQVVSDD